MKSSPDRFFRSAPNGRRGLDLRPVGRAENNRRAKYYRLTKAGRKQLEFETDRWSRISRAIAQALEA